MSKNRDVKVGILLDDSIEFSLIEVCRTCHVEADVVIELVQAGVLEPHGREPQQWRFDGYAVLRLRRALNLQRDLDINLAGAALVLDLLDEIDQLCDRLHSLEEK